MIRVYESASRTLVAASTLPERGWIHVVAPTKPELVGLQEALGFPAHFLDHATDPDELAHRHREPDGSRLIVVRVPWHPGDAADVPYRSNTLSIIVAGERIVTIANGPDEVVRDLIARGGVDLGKPHRFVLLLLWCAAARFLVHLRDAEREIARLELALQTSLANRELLSLLRYQKGLVHFTTALASNRILIEQVQKDAALELTEEDHNLLEEVLVEFRQASEMTAVSSDILNQMMDAFASIISNNLNVVMKVLTAFTLVLAVPNLIVGLFGMNVLIPWSQNPWSFPLLVSVVLAAALAVAWGVARRGWF